MTELERDLIEHWIRGGPAGLVEKLGPRHWTVGFGGYRIPCCHPTRRRAVEAAQAWVDAVRERLKEEQRTSQPRETTSGRGDQP
jgi:hypothetical protein